MQDMVWVGSNLEMNINQCIDFHVVISVFSEWLAFIYIHHAKYCISYSPWWFLISCFLFVCVTCVSLFSPQMQLLPNWLNSDLFSCSHSAKDDAQGNGEWDQWSRKNPTVLSHTICATQWPATRLSSSPEGMVVCPLWWPLDCSTDGDPSRERTCPTHCWYNFFFHCHHFFCVHNNFISLFFSFSKLTQSSDVRLLSVNFWFLLWGGDWRS